MLEARLFGGFELQLDGRPVSIPSRAAQTLLAYLLMNSQTSHRREKLSGLIWPDNTDAIARRNLRQALWFIRKALDTQDPDRVEYILADEIWVAFNAQAVYWLDVDMLAVAQPEACPTPDLLRMASAYRGDLLPGFYEDWVSLERERLNAQYDRTMQVLLARLATEQRWTDILGWAERWIATGHVPEDAYRALMIAHSNLGDRAAVAGVFQRCRSALASELGVEPSAQTLELFESLRQGSLTQSALPQAALAPGLAENGHSPAVADEAPAPGEPPFKGLQYFDEADADLFFGREQAVTRLVARLRAGHTVTVVVGASGSGKSSLLRAGLIPALRRAGQSIDDSHPPAGSAAWPIFVLTPTAHPLEALATALTSTAESVLTTATLVDDLARDARSLHLAARRLVAGKASERDSRVLLVVDQFEELFTLCQSEEERRAFLNNLFEAAGRLAEIPPASGLASRPLDRPLAIVVALRADFYAHCAQYEDLRAALETSQDYIGPMSATELRRAIEEPARRGDWTFEPGLVDLILRDTGNEPGMLPLLSHSLRETWERRQGRHLTLSGYAEAGGVHGAIAKTAERVYQGLPVREQKIARSIFLRLTELGEGTQDTRRRACIADLVLRTEDAPIVAAVLTALADARLVTLGEDSAEVAHEALIREWPTLRQWLAEDREGLQMHRHLMSAAQAWEALGRDAGELYRGARLADAREWASANASQLNPLEQAFLDASTQEAVREAAEREAQQQREIEAARRLAEEQHRSATLLRRRALSLTGALIVALLGLASAIWFANRAGSASQTNSELAAQNAAIAATAQANLSDTQRLRLAAEAKALAESGASGEVPALLALRSLRAGYSPQADAALITALSHGFTRLRLTGHTLPVTAASFSPDGHYILTASADGTARLSDPSTGREIRVYQNYYPITAATFAHNGGRVIAGTQDGKVYVWVTETGAPAGEFQAHEGAVTAVSVSPDGLRLLTAGDDGTVRLWDLDADREVRRLAGLEGPIAAATFSPDGTLVLTGEPDGKVRLWDASTGAEVRRLTGSGGKILQAGFSPDGRSIVSGSSDGTLRVLDAVSGDERLRLNLGGAIYLASFTPSGNYVLTGVNAVSALWDTQTGEQALEFVGGASPVLAGGFSPDGRSLVTGMQDGSARVWQVAQERDPVVFRHLNDDALDAAFSKDGKVLVTGHRDGSVRVWETATWTETRRLAAQSQPITSIAMSPDGRRLLAAGGESAILLDLSTGREVRRFTQPGEQLTRVTFSPDGRQAAAASTPGRVRTWDVETGRLLTDILSGSLEQTGLAYSPDGHWIAAASLESAGVWGTSPDSYRGRSLSEQTGPITSLVFSPDSRNVLTTSRDMTARLYEASTGRTVQQYLGHSAGVLSAAFSPDGRLIATGSEDKTIRLWETQTGKEVRVLAGHDDGIYRLLFTPDGNRLLSFSADGTARLWNVDLRATVQLACDQLFRDLSQQEREQYGVVDTQPTCN